MFVWYEAVRGFCVMDVGEAVGEDIAIVGDPWQ